MGKQKRSPFEKRRGKRGSISGLPSRGFISFVNDSTSVHTKQRGENAGGERPLNECIGRGI
jgi:hypothetical protein